MSGTLLPGSRIEIDEIMEALAISRQPIRDAINRLSFESFVEVIPQVGCVVARWSAPERLDVLHVNAVVEAEICALSAERRSERDLRELASLHYQIEVFLDDEAGPPDEDAATYRDLNRRFHGALFRSIGSPSLEAVANSFLNRCDFAVSSNRRERAERPLAPEERLSQRAFYRFDNRGHRAILDAIERGDPNEARSACKRHNDELVSHAT